MLEYLMQNEFDLAEKLQRVLRATARWCRVIAIGHRLECQRYYDWDRVVDQYEKLFAEISGKLDEIRPSPTPRSERFRKNEAMIAKKVVLTIASAKVEERCPANHLRLAGQILSGRFG